MTHREAYDRAFRFKRASQASVLHKDLAKSEWINPEEVRLSRYPCGMTVFFLIPRLRTQDVRYLKPHVLEVEKEDQERHVWDTVNVVRK